MTRRMLLVVVLLAIAVLAVGSSAAPPDLTLPQQVAQLQKKLRSSRLANADLRVQLAAQDAVIEDQSAQVLRLQGRLANLPDPVDVITARDADGMWSAMLAIWRAFPTLPAGSLCGFDKGSTQSADLTPTSYSFFRWTAC